MLDEAPSKPVIRYFGGKWRMAPWIIEHFPAHKIYVEPYGGAASVLIRKSPAKVEVWNDLNGELVNLFRVLQYRRQSMDLFRMLRYTPWSREENLLSYEPTDCNIEQARRYIIRNWMSIGHGQSGYSFRCTRCENSNPVTAWLGYLRQFSTYINRFKEVIIENDNATGCIDRYDTEDTLFYIDPPYVTETRYKKNQYCTEMTDFEHMELASVLHRIKGFVVLSGYDCDLYRELYQNWHSEARKSQINGGKTRTEMLWLNERAAAAQKQMRLFQ